MDHPRLIVGPTGARYCGRRLPCSIGRGGVSQTKREGDLATPAAVLHPVLVLFRPDRMRQPRTNLPCRAIGLGDLWSDDPRDPDYNTLISGPGHGFSHEKLRRSDPLYDLVVVTDWNHPDAQPGAGSAIFLHKWRKPGFPTEGCIAFARADLIWLVERLSQRTCIIAQP